MSEDLSVLLLGSSGPSDQLQALLEKQGIFGDQVRRGELTNMMRLADPALLIQFGREGAADVVKMLQSKPIAQRVRLVIIAERPDLAELRKLDREIVASLLATDMPESVLAARISMLARKKAAESRTKQAAAQQRAGSTPQSDIRKTAPEANEEAHSVSLSEATVEISVAEAMALHAAAVPNSLPPPPDKPAPPPKDIAPAPETAPAKVIAQISRPQHTRPMTPAGEPRVLVADSDIMRGDGIARNLRHQGILTLFVPLDPAKTRWPLVRQFQPNLLIVDSAELRSQGQVWHQLLMADQALSGILTAPVQFDHCFDETSGAVDLALIAPHLPQLVGAIPREPESTLVIPAVTDIDPAGIEEVPPSGRPTFFDAPPVDAPSNENSPFIAPEPPGTGTVPVIDQQTTTFQKPRGSRGADVQPAGIGPNIDENPTVALPPKVVVPLSDPSDEPTRAAAPSSADLEAAGLTEQITTFYGKAEIPTEQATTFYKKSDLPTVDPVQEVDPFKKPKARRGWLVAVLVALAIGAGAWGYRKKIVPLMSPAPSKSQVPAAPPTPKEVDGDADSPSEPEVKFSPWSVPPPKDAKTCTDLVSDVEAIKAGGLAQANASWTNARKSLVLGELDAAHVSLCEAGIAHPQGLAVEGLVEILLARHETLQAQEWMKEAITARPDRRKTIELDADVKAQLGQIEEAKAAWSGALNVDPGNERAAANIGLHYENEGEDFAKNENWAKAELMFRRAVVLNEKSARAAAGLAQAFLAQGFKEHAEYWDEKALELDPNFGPALVVQGELAVLAGDKETALRLFKQALKFDPGNTRAHQQIFKLDPR